MFPEKVRIRVWNLRASANNYAIRIELLDLPGEIGVIRPIPHIVAKADDGRVVDPWEKVFFGFSPENDVATVEVVGD